MQEIHEISKCADYRIIIHRISHEIWVAGYVVSWITRVWWMYVPTPVQLVPETRMSWLVASAARIPSTPACIIVRVWSGVIPFGSLLMSKMTLLLPLNSVASLVYQDLNL